MTATALAEPTTPRLRVQYEPAPLVQRFIEDSAFMTAYFGPLGCGKTTAGAMKAWVYGQSWPGARIAVIRDTWPNLRDTTQTTFFKWFPPGQAGEYHKTSRTYRMRTAGEKPVEVLFRAMDQADDVANVLSLDLAAAWVDEPQGGLALREESGARLGKDPGLDYGLFLSILARLGRQTGYPPMGWLTGNPPTPRHWIAKEFRYPGTGVPSNPRAGFRLYLGDQDTNRAHLRAGYYEQLEEYFGVDTPMSLRFLQGQWIAFTQLEPFKAEWMRRWHALPPLADLAVSIGVDPAISKKDTACQTALVVTAQPLRDLRAVETGDQASRLEAYTLKALQGHWTAYETVERLFALMREFQGAGRKALVVEGVAYQRVLGEILDREAALEGFTLWPLHLVEHPDGDKLRRATGKAARVEAGLVLFGGPGSAALIDALLAVPHDPGAWDLVDAFGLSLDGLPVQRAERMPLHPVGARSDRQRAISYAVKTVVDDPSRPKVTHMGPNPLWRYGASVGRRRAVSYAIKTGMGMGR